ncbi:hypothetical protein [Pseudovibrio sp. POLY-S9]|uniref:hypothetical protein n=1 Tax=Pseudovibrio sp. POLY-S9 TaxID=1576596 RepID=UPI00070BE2EC|nr:hypothetical protein [Pseudovibrio sp. POLY-S9]
MFFAKLCRIAAYLALVLGAFKVVMGFIGASFPPEDRIAFARHVLGSADTGEAIDKGTYYIGIAIIFGVLFDICSHIKQINDKS